ncbi:unnamed protein product [[Candida] boidinii]|nr:unnamed protein product [[Candida] boidinii]
MGHSLYVVVVVVVVAAAAAGYWALDTGYWILNAGYWITGMLDARDGSQSKAEGRAVVRQARKNKPSE